MARLPALSNPLSALEAMGRSAYRGTRRALGAEVPGSQALLDYIGGDLELLHRALQPLGFDEMFLGKPAYSEEYGGAPMSIGQAPILPGGRFGELYRYMGGPRRTPAPAYGDEHDLLREGFRMGPARTKGEEMKRQHTLRGMREDRRALNYDLQGIKFLPELSPQQNAFRQYLMKQGPGSEAGYAQLFEDMVRNRFASGPLRQGATNARVAQKNMLIEELDDLLPEGTLDTLYQELDSPVFNEVLGIVSDLSARSRMGQLEGASPPTWGGNPRGLDQVEEFLNSKQRIERQITRSAHEAAAEGEFERAARLAAQLWRYGRSPRENFNAKYGRHINRETPMPGEPVRPTEGKAWVDEVDAARKALFREMNAKRRLYRGRT